MEVKVPNSKVVNLVLVNLMPTKEQTEAQFRRVLEVKNTKVNIELVCAKSHISKNTDLSYIENNYKSIYDVQHRSYDLVIVTGAPIEHLEYEEVDYWDEMKAILDFSAKNVQKAMYICWGAQAALYYFYGLNKVKLDKKIFGVFKNDILDRDCTLFSGIRDYFYAPHSRHTEIKIEDILKINELKIAAISAEAGAHIVVSKDYSRIFAMGHSEYDLNTLKSEYERDINKGLNIDIPKNYFEDDNPKNSPIDMWSCDGNKIFDNLINNK